MAIDLDKGVSLCLAMKVGQFLSYKITTKVQQRVIASGTVLNEQANEFFSKLSQRVLAADDDGSLHVVSTTTPYEGDGQRQVIYQQLSRQGNVIETTGGVPSSAYSFPADPVKLEASWQGEVKLQIPTQPDPVVCRSTYKVDGTEKVAGYECVRINVESEEIEFEVPSPDGNGMARVTMGSSGVMHFAPELGTLVRMELETDTTPTFANMKMETSNLVIQELETVK